MNILKGKKFGRLTAIKRVPNDKWGNIMWLCKCNCGTEIITREGSLRSGHTRSCGCLRRENARMGKNRKLSPKLANKFELTEEQFIGITQKDCFYCGTRPNNIAKRILLNQRKDSDDFIYNGIDRVDNTKDYTIDNVVPCCKICNFAKRNMSLKDFKNWIERVYNKMFFER
jgi:hypothetical protein